MMSAYDSLKVTELKTLIKEREIPAQGLTRKAQFIEALKADDEKNEATTGTNDEEATAEAAEVEVEQAQPEEVNNDNAGVEPAATAASADQAVDAPEPETQVSQEANGAEEDSKTTADETSNPIVVESRDSSERKRKRETSIDEEDASEANAKKAKTENEQPGHERTAPTKEQENAALDDAQTSANTASEPMEDVAYEEEQSLPSEHVPTAVLYIRNLMRPLQAQAFRADLLEIADPSGRERDSAITNLFLDILKTHAFVVCSSMTTASRLRSALHNSPWPQHETQRKALWVDFVPESKVYHWIEEENRAGRDARFEVVYSGKTGEKTAELSEVNARPTAPREPPALRDPTAPGQGMPGAPQGPRGQRPSRQAPLAATESAPKQQSAPLNKLDTFFRYTAAKPKIYYQPVDKSLVDKRLDELDRETSRDWRGGQSWNRSTRLAPIDQLRRYTFDDGDKVVDGGMDFGGFGRRQGAGGASTFNPNAGRGGGGGGRGRGGYRP